MKLFKLLLLLLSLFTASYNSLNAMELESHQSENPYQNIKNYLELLPREIYQELQKFISSNPETFFWLLLDQLYKRAPTVRLQGHTNLVSALALDPENNNQLISGSWDRTKKVWNLSNKTLIKNDSIYTPIHSLMYAVASQKVITSNELGLVIDKPSTNFQYQPVKLRRTECFILNEPSNELICGLKTGKIKFLDLTTNTITSTLKNDFGPITTLVLASNNLFVGTSYGVISLCDLFTKKCEPVGNTATAITAMAYDSIKNHIYWTGDFDVLHKNHSIKVWDLNSFYNRETTITDTQEKNDIIPTISNFPITNLILDPLNNRLISGSPHSIKVWDLATKKCIGTQLIHSYIIERRGIGYDAAPKFIPIILDTKNNRLIYGNGNDIEIFNLSDPHSPALTIRKFHVLLQKAYECWQQQEIKKDQNFLVKSFTTLKEYTLGANVNHILDLTQDEQLHQTFSNLPGTLQQTIKNKITVLLPKS